MKKSMLILILVGFVTTLPVIAEEAASELYEEESGLYNLRREGKKLTGVEMVDFPTMADEQKFLRLMSRVEGSG